MTAWNRYTQSRLERGVRFFWLDCLPHLLASRALAHQLPWSDYWTDPPVQLELPQLRPGELVLAGWFVLRPRHLGLPWPYQRLQ